MVYTDAAETIEVEVGETFAIALEANPTTGYVWRVAYDTHKLGLVDRQLQRTSDAIGAGGTEQFKFRLLCPGEIEVAFIYERPWEGQPLRKKVFRVVGERSATAFCDALERG